MQEDNEQRKKILYVITKGNWGGAQKYVYDLATSLPQEKYDIAVALGEGEQLAAKLGEKNIKVIKLNRSQRDINFFKDFGLLFDLIRLYQKEKPDIVHLNSSKIGGVGALAARIYNLLQVRNRKKLRTIFTAHGWAFNERRPDWQRTIIKILHWITVILCHQTICIAKKEYDQMINWPWTKGKLTVIYNGQNEIDFKTPHEAKQFILSKIPLVAALPETASWIGTVAELHKNKGLDYAIEAVNLFIKNNPEQPIIFFVIGEGEERRDLEKMIVENGLENNVFLLGAIDNAKTYLKAFDIFTLTSRKEGLPYSLLEAGLASLPVIASNVGGIEEIIESEKTGLLIRPGHPKEIKIALEKLVFDRKLRENLGHNLYIKVKENFSIEQMIEKTINLY
jgi:glycosyltransferase involved in cell wall biosynthesis